uniref:Uncharacterized protein n=1 Tax=Meloidogyne enterolobii TaxID=390850 RepID=A0A6V7XPT5_MELEN|nr:unnamed protein product [Meloidogyne enterolobii]
MTLGGDKSISLFSSYFLIFSITCFLFSCNYTLITKEIYQILRVPLISRQFLSIFSTGTCVKAEKLNGGKIPPLSIDHLNSAAKMLVLVQKKVFFCFTTSSS